MAAAPPARVQPADVQGGGRGPGHAGRRATPEAGNPPEDPNIDVIWQFNLPATERLKVLKLLDRSNINAFSLFQSEESLMETMAFREIDCHQQ